MLKQSLKLVPLRQDLYKAKVVFWAFIASLTMFFLGGMASYLIIRKQAFMPIQRSYESVQLPWLFWVSTFFLIATSLLLERACWFVRREMLKPFFQSLVLAMLVSAGFVLLQGVGMYEMVTRHFSQLDGSTKLYGLSVTLVFVHALHVVGGMVYLGFVMFRAQRLKYDHERHWAVDHCAGYWHFLDVVWFAMIGLFWWAG